MERTSSVRGSQTLRTREVQALTWPDPARYAGRSEVPAVLITLNGERFELERPITVLDLLARLDIDPRRVAIEHNLEIIRRRTFESAVVQEGDRVEIVNAVGGG
jgi:sulfur carrier protein